MTFQPPYPSFTAPPTFGGPLAVTTSEVTTDQTLTTGDLGKRYLYTSSTTADKTLTLPSVSSSESNKDLWIHNFSDYTITITASDSDTIGWPALAVTSAEILPLTGIRLTYRDNDTRWDISDKFGGQCRPSGTKAYWSFDTTVSDHLGSVQYQDETQRHSATGALTTTGVITSGGNQKFGPASVEFNGTNQYLSANDSTDWDVFGSTSGAVTVCGWVYCDLAAGAVEAILSHYEDANNLWNIVRLADGSCRIYLFSGSGQISANGGSLTQNTWHHIAMCRVGAETGLYIDGTQVAYDATFTPDTFSGQLFFGQSGASGNYFDGRLDDWAIVYSNIFGAAPVVGVTDTITIDTLNPLGLVL